MKEFNAKSLKLSMHNYYEAEEVTSYMINMPKVLIRSKIDRANKNYNCAAEKYTGFFRSMNIVVTDRQGNRVNLKDQQ